MTNFALSARGWGSVDECFIMSKVAATARKLDSELEKQLGEDVIHE